MLSVAWALGKPCLRYGSPYLRLSLIDPRRRRTRSRRPSTARTACTARIASLHAACAAWTVSAAGLRGLAAASTRSEVKQGTTHKKARVPCQPSEDVDSRANAHITSRDESANHRTGSRRGWCAAYSVGERGIAATEPAPQTSVPKRSSAPAAARARRVRLPVECGAIRPRGRQRSCSTALVVEAGALARVDRPSHSSHRPSASSASSKALVRLCARVTMATDDSREPSA